MTQTPATTPFDKEEFSDPPTANILVWFAVITFITIQCSMLSKHLSCIILKEEVFHESKQVLEMLLINSTLSYPIIVSNEFKVLIFYCEGVVVHVQFHLRFMDESLPNINGALSLSIFSMTSKSSVNLHSHRVMFVLPNFSQSFWHIPSTNFNTLVVGWITTIPLTCSRASLLLKQILMYDVIYDVPTSWHGSVCPVYVPWFTQALSY